MSLLSVGRGQPSPIQKDYSSFSDMGVYVLPYQTSDKLSKETGKQKEGEERGWNGKARERKVERTRETKEDR